MSLSANELAQMQADGGTDEDAIMACIGAAKKVRDNVSKKMIEISEDVSIPAERLVELYRGFEDATKAESLGEQERKIRDAFYAQYRKPAPPMPEVAADCWVNEVYEDHVIVEMAGALYKYDFTVTDEQFVFAEPVKVEIEYVVAKSLPVKAGSGLQAIKMLTEDEGEAILGGYGMVWGSEAQRDLSPWPNADGTKGEFFTPDTAGLDDLPVKVLTFEHDKDKDEEGKPIKEILGLTILERDDKVGRWVEARVDKARKYAAHVLSLAKKKVLHFSSESASHWREVASNGAIKRWRTAGYTMTTNPMEPRSTQVEQLKAAYKSMGLDTEPFEEPGGADAGASGGELELAKVQAEAILLGIEL
jgi:hypothetical protein